MDDRKTNETFHFNEIHVWCNRCGRSVDFGEDCKCDRFRRAGPGGPGPMGMTTRRRT